MQVIRFFIKNNKDGSSTARPSVNLNSPHSGNKILSIETSPFDPTMFLVSSDNSCLSVWKVSVSGSGNNATVESELARRLGAAWASFCFRSYTGRLVDDGESGANRSDVCAFVDHFGESINRQWANVLLVQCSQ